MLAPGSGSLNNAKKMLCPGSGSLNNIKTMKVTRALNAESLDTSVPPSCKYPEFLEVRACFPRFSVAINWRNKRSDKSF